MMFPFKTKKPEPEAAVPTDVEVIRAKIAACDVAITETEAEFQRLSLSAALSDEPTAGMEVMTKLNELRTRRDVLCDGLRAAQELERENAHRLSEREFVARKRSLAQKIGQMNRDAVALTDALAVTRDAFRRMAGTAGGIDALLPPDLRIDTARLLSPSYLRSLAEIEVTRLSDGGIAAPGARPLVASRDESGGLATLAETIAGLCVNVRDAFERCGPVQPAECEHSAQDVTA